MIIQNIELVNGLKLSIKIPNNIDFVEPLIELYRGKLYLNIIRSFSNDCINNFGTQIFSIKKSYIRTLTNILSSWIFSLYIDYNYENDYFFPSNYSNTILLEKILLDLCKYDYNIINIQSKINNIIDNLKNIYKQSLELLDNYKKSQLFKKNKDNYKIKKSFISNNNTLFVKFDIMVKYEIKEKKLINIINNILIPKKIYDRLINLYTGPKYKINDYLWSIIFRYQLLGSNNHQLAVLPDIMNKMNKDYELNFECFASSINSTFNNYCSIYYDLERYFGSVGSFFNIVPKKGTFGFNPPYQHEIIITGIRKLFNFLDNTNEHLTFIITIPIWDLEGKSIIKQLYNNELEKQNIDYGDFEIIQEIKMSKYFKGLRMIPKEKFTYIDHNFELYKNKTIQNTYIILLSNNDINFENINDYNFEK